MYRKTKPMVARGQLVACALLMNALTACTEPLADDGPGSDAGAQRDASQTRDASRSDATSADAAPTEDDGEVIDATISDDADTGDRVPMFVAVGYGFRRVISCDDGRTWQNDLVENPNGGHDGSLARGLGYGDGLFVAAVGGGGGEGRIVTSRDGVMWTPIIDAGTYNGFSDVAYGSGYHVAGGGHISIRSATGGVGTWGPTVSMGEGGILRHLLFADGHFVAVGGNRIQVSTDAASWHAPTSGTCGEPEAIAYGGGKFLAVDLSGNTCLSSDGGATWTNGSIGGNNVRGVVHTGAEFVVTTASNTYRSTNGIAFTGSMGGGPMHLARSDAGTVVGYTGTTFQYSTNGGATFTNATVPASAGNRDITRIVFGYGSPSASGCHD